MNETHLIDGAMGRPHVNALDIRMHNASLFGDGVYITEGLDGLPVTVVDANTVSVGRGVMLINGARITQEEKIDLTIESGSQGMNRNDLLVATYTYDAANTRCEDVNLEIVTGTPTAGTAADPAIHSGTLLDINSADLVEGVSTVQVPIARIPLTGTTVGAPAILAKKFGTIQDIRDSVSPKASEYWTVLNFSGVRIAWIIGGTSNGALVHGSNMITFELPFTPKANNAVSVFASLIGTGAANVDNFTDVEILPSINGNMLSTNVYNSGQHTVVNASVSIIVLERLKY